jgi:hypothetical protein
VTDPNWNLWQSERKTPTPEDRRLDRPTDPLLMTGYWRIERAKTRHDTPVLIWTEAGQEHTIYQRGATVWNTLGHADKWQDFLDKDWLHCVAVTKADWSQALETGFWPDGKPAKMMSQEEKLGISTEPGDNQGPVEELLSEQIAELADKASKTAVIDQPSADTATGILDRLRLLLQKAEAKRVEEKEPFLEGGRQVDAKWKGVRQPGLDAGEALDKRRRAWLRQEQARLDAIAAEETRKAQEAARAEQERIAEEENAKRAAEAEEKGEAPPEPVQPEDVQVAVPEVAAERATAGSAYGRNSGLRRVKVAKITDIRVFAGYLVDSQDVDMMACLRKRADAAARAKIALPGLTLEDELQ